MGTRFLTLWVMKHVPMALDFANTLSIFLYFTKAK